MHIPYSLIALSCMTLSFIAISPSLRAELVIPIVEGVDNPTMIAISPFAYAGADPLSEKVDEIISADLYRSGQFNTIAARDMLSFPSRPSDVVFRCGVC